MRLSAMRTLNLCAIFHIIVSNYNIAAADRLSICYTFYSNQWNTKKGTKSLLLMRQQPLSQRLVCGMRHALCSSYSNINSNINSDKDRQRQMRHDMINSFLLSILFVTTRHTKNVFRRSFVAQRHLPIATYSSQMKFDIISYETKSRLDENIGAQKVLREIYLERKY